MNYINTSISCKTKLEILNVYILHLKVLFLSNIINNKGNSLTKYLLLCVKQIYRLATYTGLFSLFLKKSWLLWSCTISKLYYTNDKLDILRKEKKLEHCKGTNFKYTQQHHFLNSPCLQKICHSKNNTINQSLSSPILSQTITTISYFQTKCKNISEDYFPIEEIHIHLNFQVKLDIGYISSNTTFLDPRKNIIHNNQNEYSR